MKYTILAEEAYAENGLVHQETQEGIGWLRCPKVEAAGLQNCCRKCWYQRTYDDDPFSYLTRYLTRVGGNRLACQIRIDGATASGVSGGTLYRTPRS